MRIIKGMVVLFLFVSAIARAETDADCLKHLGGALSGVECYSGLSTDLSIENNSLLMAIDKTIPIKDGNRNLLRQYMKQQDRLRKYCLLSKNALNQWDAEQREVNPRYHDYDVVYAECIYDLLKQQNAFLKKVLESTSL